MTTYTETITNRSQLFNVHTKLKSKNFEQVDANAMTETWENPATEERVIINKVLK